MSTPPLTGLLLANLGSPAAPTPAAVRRFLRAFLGDRRVLDMHPLGRAALLNLVILPWRPRRVAELYRKVWLPEGSPLLVHGRALAQGVAALLGPATPVALGMRYGAPSLESALLTLYDQGVRRIRLLPLYPQFAASTTGAILEEVYRIAGGLWDPPHIEAILPYFDHPAFVAAWVAVARPVLDEARPDFVLFSYHGLPERQIRRSDPTGRCLTAGCCDGDDGGGRLCYRAQCLATTRALRGALGLGEGETTTAFQSRFGRIPWIGPATDREIVRLATAGVRRLAVLSPAFTADCLETVEEINLRGRAAFLAAGGESFTLVPSLNGDPAWVAAVVQIAREGRG
ncbi:MAG: ferrochelatase [Nitrospirae bacterium CG18_big_fil_WC_8_21_14_2_50_70_55]|nr:ferrochelatase [Deltaproteobacteria bacterium]OIP62999.1 MAG: ferrochelatase [Nitrospirae bacterium CG2_30_70_394]PIQ05327.1 MAG: ferrochelatase [Nitrospirae bacterium CG18_big_fil_WC_8_21_14_2_50_70_55]PIU79652.1 MAG: ferrochelatase [Nitrospirae bacterium CG06_land_8_20_14_3_00_70_43]PIW82836.1 MAG: ferrochelatase [Nitrospirae bacterium CG_4_8_14_3_um_filter_70_85]PIX83149.1 MAG: ferrochelatase [Nitrospirae bacterium CG_4_10_14_3_um_filter_70_108]PJB95625.1 MAG: ferrochelatase [Nitrospira